MIELDQEIIEEKDDQMYSFAGTAKKEKGDILHDDALKELLSAGTESIERPTVIAEEENDAHNQLIKDFAAAVGAVEIQSPGRKASDGSFDREWRISVKKSVKKQRKADEMIAAKKLARGDSFEDLAADGFSDIGDDDFDEAAQPAPVRHNSIVGKEQSA